MSNQANFMQIGQYVPVQPYGYGQYPAQYNIVSPPKRIAYTGGTFDLFHAGHVSFLQKCKQLCDTLVVGLNADQFVREYKGRLPHMSFRERKLILESCKYVDRVIEHKTGYDSKPTVTQSNAKLVIHGDDWTGEAYMKQMGFTDEWLDKNGITVVYVPYTKGTSTSALIKMIKADAD